MACLFGHKWNGCKCVRCGAVRDEQHDWDLCKGKCKRCGKTQAERHDWNGCKCESCGAVRDEQHKWNSCKCESCGKVRDEQHVWNIYECSVCGKKSGIDQITDQSAIARVIAEQLAIVAQIYKQTATMDSKDKNRLNLMRRCGKIERETRELLKKVTDQSLLADIALNTKISVVRIDAAERQTDKSILRDVYVDVLKADDDFSTQSAMIEKLKDQFILGSDKENCHTLYEAFCKLGIVSGEQERDEKIRNAILYNENHEWDYISERCIKKCKHCGVEQVWHDFIIAGNESKCKNCGFTVYERDDYADYYNS